MLAQLSLSLEQRSPACSSEYNPTNEIENFIILILLSNWLIVFFILHYDWSMIVFNLNVQCLIHGSNNVFNLMLITNKRG